MHVHRARRTSIAGVIAVAAAFLTACSSNSDQATGGTGADGAPSAPADSTSAAAGASTGGGGPVDCVNGLKGLSLQDRETELYEGAKGEGAMTLYTTLVEEQIQPTLIKGFEAKYPGTKVDVFRSNTSGLAAKMIAEGDAGKPVSSVWSASDGPSIKYQDSYDYPTAAKFDKSAVDPDGYWAADVLYFLGFGVNTQLLPAGKEPTDYQGLLDPALKGRMAWSSTSASTGPLGFIATVLDTMGEQEGMAYLEKLSQQDIHLVGGSARAVLDDVVAGTYSLNILAYSDHVADSVSKGAPVDWVPMGPTLVTLHTIGLTKNGPQPCTARLFVDYTLDVEGQQQLSDAAYIPANPEVSPKDPDMKIDSPKFKTYVLNSNDFAKDRAKVAKIRKDLFGLS